MKLPPLPKPDTRTDWHHDGYGKPAFTTDLTIAYGQQCYQQALEDAALACRYLKGFTKGQCEHFESAVRSLNNKGD